MMICYTGLTKLKTKPIVYQDVLLASDSGTLQQLRELSSKRKAIEGSINENNHLTEAIAREMSGGLTSRCEQDIQKLERYLPLLENLVRCINAEGKSHQMISWVGSLGIRWSSVLTSSPTFSIGGPKFYQFDDLYFELGMILFLYGAMLRERAMEVSSSDPVQSATLYRRAAGVYKYLAEEILIHLFQTADRPPEIMPRMSTVMSSICLAEAQAVAARRAEEKSSSTSAFLAKLHYGVAKILAETTDVLQVTTKECKEASSRLLDYVLSCMALHELKCYKYAAEGLKGEGKIGVAIGVVRWALANAKKNLPKEESWRSAHGQAVDDLSDVLRKYERENEFVWCEKIPFNDQLPLPQGAKIFDPIPYQPQQWELTLAFKSVQ